MQGFNKKYAKYMISRLAMLLSGIRYIFMVSEAAGNM